MSMNALGDWFAKQSDRDQRIVVIGGVLVAMVLLVWLALLPGRAAARAEAKVGDQQQLLAYMRSVGPALAAAGPVGELQPINESFVVFVDRTAREHGLGEALTGSPPSGDGAFRVTFENADFNLLLTWVYQVSTRYGIKVEAANVSATSAPGKVNASVQVRPPA